MEATGSAELRDVYEEQYSAGDADAARYGRWRALCAEGKADHVVRLAAELDRPPAAVAEVGCGDGVLLELMARRGLGETHHGYEISERAVQIATDRLGPGAVERFDGEHLPVADATYDLGVLSHVLEHVPDPLPLLRETGRAAGAVVVEVPLEDNRSASRPEAERARQEIGHLHRFNRGDIHVLCAAAGLRVVAELADPLPLKVHTFFAESASARAKAVAKAAVRRGVYVASAKAAERSFTVHYACLAVSR
ncbi:MAG TPA: class I SAM-dependent methyltransferase [Thermoleophilaceae bacterium]|nr:class I SAM-dependent methyltransferase [Thermoleophilaceae bacterium]